MTTVGETLNHRSDLQKRLERLEERLRKSVLVQEGDEPPEQPDALLDEHSALCDQLERVIAQINHTNAASRLPSGETVTVALARRDVLEMRAAALRTAIRAATNDGLFGRYSRSEIRLVRQIRVDDVQARLDAYAKERRELDTRLQEHNWTNLLIE